MKAVVYHSPGNVAVEQVPVPECGDSEILVKVEACAVCGSDLKSYKHGNPRIKPPLILGHEFAGIIEDIGDQVAGYVRGERIVMATSVSCGHCIYCTKGWNNLCINLAPMGFSYNGGMAEYVLIPREAIKVGHIVKVPLDLKAEYAALAEPFSCAVNAIENCCVKKGDVVAILGAGPMGLINVSVAKSYGANKILVSEVSEKRLSQARSFDCDVVIDPRVEDIYSVVMNETSGLGADVVIVAAPAAKPQEQAVSLVKKRGTICLFASLPVGNEIIQIDSRKIHYGELRLIGTSDSRVDHVQKAVGLLNTERSKVKELVTDVLSIDDVTTAFDLMEKGAALRVVLEP